MDPYYIGFTSKCDQLGVTPDVLFKTAGMGRLFPYSARLIAKLRGAGTRLGKSMPRVNLGKKMLMASQKRGPGSLMDFNRETANIGQLLGTGQRKIIRGIGRVTPGSLGKSMRGYAPSSRADRNINRALKYTGLGTLMGGAAVSERPRTPPPGSVR
jgi:hypothetical protein